MLAGPQIELSLTSDVKERMSMTQFVTSMIDCNTQC